MNSSITRPLRCRHCHQFFHQQGLGAWFLFSLFFPGGLLFLVHWLPGILFMLGSILLAGVFIRLRYPLAYGLGSVVCFLAYAFDKSAATAGRWRTPERTLLLLGLAGGWPGGLVAQHLLRHKTAKPSFRAAFWATVALNVAGLLVWTTPILGQLGSR